MIDVSSSGESRCVKFARLSFCNICERSSTHVFGNLGLHESKRRAIRGYDSCLIESIGVFANVKHLWTTSTVVVRREQHGWFI